MSNIGNHEIVLDAYEAGSGNVNTADPKFNVIYTSYADVDTSIAFKDDNNYNYDRWLTNPNAFFKQPNLVDRNYLKQKDTDRETINPANYANMNMKYQVDSLIDRRQHTGDGIVYGCTKIVYNREHAKDHFNPASMSTFKQDPKFANGNITYGANKGINDNMLTAGSGTHYRSFLNGENQQTVNKKSIGEQRVNPNKLMKEDYRIQNYLIDGLVNNPYSVYNPTNTQEIPAFYQNSRDKNNYFNKNKLTTTTNNPFSYLDNKLSSQNMIY